MTTQRPDFSTAGKVFADEWSRIEKKKQPTIAESFGWLCAGLCMQVIFGIIGMLLWNWFIPEIFIGFPRLNLAGAIGLSLVTHYLTGRSDLLREEDITKVYSNGIASAIVFLVMGFVVKQFL